MGKEFDQDEWNIKIFIPLFIVICLADISLVCMCEIGSARVEASLFINLLIACRYICAYLSNEKNRGWIFYIFLIIVKTPVFMAVINH